MCNVHVLVGVLRVWVWVTHIHPWGNLHLVTSILQQSLVMQRLVTIHTQVSDMMLHRITRCCFYLAIYRLLPTSSVLQHMLIVAASILFELLSALARARACVCKQTCVCERVKQRTNHEANESSSERMTKRTNLERMHQVAQKSRSEAESSRERVKQRTSQAENESSRETSQAGANNLSSDVFKTSDWPKRSF